MSLLQQRVIQPYTGDAALLGSVANYHDFAALTALSSILYIQGDCSSGGQRLRMQRPDAFLCSMQHACMMPQSQALTARELLHKDRCIKKCTCLPHPPSSNWIRCAGKVYSLEEARAAAQESIREGRGGKVYIASE